MSAEPETAVRTALRSRESLTDDAINEMLACFADGAIWHNMPGEPAVGKAAIAATLRWAVPVPESLHIEIKSIATCGTTVFVERVDTHSGAGRTIVMPCCGVFETENGLIKVWRDYFDMQTWLDQVGA